MQCTALVLAESAGALGIKIAVGNQRAVAGNAQLTAVGVAGHDQLRAVFSHRVQHPQVGRVRDGEGEISTGVEGAGDIVVVVSTDMRVIHAANIDLAAVDLEARLRVRQIEPTAGGEAGHQVLPRQHWSVRLQARWALQVARGVDGLGGVVVVTAQHKRTGDVEQRLKRVDDFGDCVLVRKEIAGGDHRVGLQLAQTGNPFLLLRLPRDEVQVRKVQHAQIGLLRGKNSDACSAQGESFRFPACVDQGTEAERDGGGQEPPAGVHLTMMARPWSVVGGKMRTMAELKDNLQADLTASIKARDEVTSATIRMVLAAITTEEVSGKEARELTDDDVITVLGREAKKRREAAEAYDDAGRSELADKERAELTVIEAYLPEQMSEEEVRAIVDSAVAEVAASGAEGGKAMGAVMKIVQPKVKGKADGSAVAALVKSALGM